MGLSSLDPIGKKLKKQGNRAVEAERIAQQQRQEAAQFGFNIDKNQRDFYDTNVAPIESGLSADVMGGFNKPESDIRTGAVAGVNAAFDKAAGIQARDLARYGIAPSQSQQRRLDLERSLASVNASNEAVETAKTNNLSRGAQFYSLGAGLPNQSAALGQAAIASQAEMDQTKADLEMNKFNTPFASLFKDGGKVDLKSGSFIMPADVVQKLGKEFFDEMVKTKRMPALPKMMADGGSVGQYINPVLKGIRAGLVDRQQREMAEVQIEAAREGLAYTKEQRVRQSRQQDVDEEFRNFSLEHKKAMGSLLASSGQNFQPVVDLFQKQYGIALEVQRDKDNNYLMSVVSPDGQKSTPKKLSFDEFGVQAASMANPDFYFNWKAKVAKTGANKPVAFSKNVLVPDGNGGWKVVTGPGVAAGDHKPTNAAKTKAELIASGTPDKLAHAIAYKLVEKIQNPMGLGARWVHKETGKPVASMDESGDYKLEDGWKDLQKQGAITKPTSADDYFSALRSHPANKDASDAELRAYVQQKLKPATAVADDDDEEEDEDDEDGFADGGMVEESEQDRKIREAAEVARQRTENIADKNLVIGAGNQKKLRDSVANRLRETGVFKHGGLVGNKRPHQRGITNVNRKTNIPYDNTPDE